MSKTKRLATAAVAVAAASILPVTVATPAGAAIPCRTISLYRDTQYSQTVLLAGAYTSAGAIDVQLTCGVVINGVTAARQGEKIPGPVAVVEGTARIAPTSSFTSCYELRVVYVDSPATVTDTCP